MKLKLLLEKEGVTTTREYSLSGLGLAHAAKEIRKLIDEKWVLLNAESDNPQVEAFINKQIADYNVSPKDYKIPLRDTVKLGKEVVHKSQ